MEDGSWALRLFSLILRIGCPGRLPECSSTVCGVARLRHSRWCFLSIVGSMVRSARIESSSDAKVRSIALCPLEELL